MPDELFKITRKKKGTIEFIDARPEQLPKQFIIMCYKFNN